MRTLHPLPCGLLTQGGARGDAKAGGREPALEGIVPLLPPQLPQEGRKEDQRCLAVPRVAAKEPEGERKGSCGEQAGDSRGKRRR